MEKDAPRAVASKLSRPRHFYLIKNMELCVLRVRQMKTPYFLRRKSLGFVEGVPRKNSTQVELVSPQRSLQRYSRLLKLASDVKANWVKGGTTSNERFLPNDKLEYLVTKENVLLTLQETTIEQKDHDDLATWVLECGKRLFLILVLLTRDSEEQLSRLKDLRNDGINDSALPLCFSEAEHCYGYSLAAESDGLQKFHSFKDWEDNNLVLFRVFQWIFLAPVFGCGTKFRHQLHSEQPLPLLNVAKPAKHGNLGEVQYGEIHPAHIDSQCLSTLGVGNNSGVQNIPVFTKMVQPSDNLHQFFDIDTGNFKARHPIISPRRIKPIGAYKKNDENFIIFRLVSDGKLSSVK
ncbi:hypothetical protein F4680DRAFT_422085 [Xylaria scruposa]|nr:hypothetical protein F4680DRAFT_422085 [Xylaria scruposa]